MKTTAILSLFCLLFLGALAQTPQAFKYQAVARDASGNILTNKSISFKISILSGSVSGIVVYSETHTGKTTNAFGLVELEIGKGSAVSGAFSSMSWGNSVFFIKIEMDPAGGIAYQTMGTGQLLSVPYALQAKSVESISTDATLSGSGNITSPLKIAPQSATSGQVLKFNGSAWSPANDKAGGLMLPYKDSITVPDQATVFRISCIGNTWSSAITGVSKSTNGTGVIGEGPFGVVGTATSPGGTGVRGSNASPTGSGFGLSGVAVSPQSGGVWAVGGLYGVEAVAESSSGYGLYGYATSSSGTTYGVYGKVKSSAGFSGYFTGGKFYAGNRVGIGTENPSAGLHLKGTTFPESFMFLEADAGQDAGFRLYEGSTAKWHIFNNSGAGGLQIYNSAATTAIFCKQSNSYVGIGTATPAYQLHVNGEAAKSSGTTAWVISSDIRLKNLLGRYEKGLDEILALEPVKFTYKLNNPRQLPTGQEQVGFIAQDVRKVFPEAVSEAADGYLDFNIHAINVALVNAIKTLDEKIDRLESENNLLKARLGKIEAILEVRAGKQ